MTDDSAAEAAVCLPASASPGHDARRILSYRPGLWTAWRCGDEDEALFAACCSTDRCRHLSSVRSRLPPAPCATPAPTPASSHSHWPVTCADDMSPPAPTAETRREAVKMAMNLSLPRSRSDDVRAPGAPVSFPSQRPSGSRALLQASAAHSASLGSSPTSPPPAVITDPSRSRSRIANTSNIRNEHGPPALLASETLRTPLAASAMHS